MTYIVPNYFIENSYKNLIKIDNLYCLNHITKYHENFVTARNTMHSMVILLDGAKILHYDNTEYQIHKDDITFLTQNNYFLSHRIPKIGNYKSLILYFDDNFIHDFIKKYRLNTNNKFRDIVKINYKIDKSLHNAVNSFLYYLDMQMDSNLLKLKIEEIFLLTLKNKKVGFTAFLHKIVSTSKERVKNILESNIDIIYTIDDMCYLTKFSKEKLRRYIKTQYNTTPKAWIDKHRLQRAKIMLKQKQKNISDISTECGYATTSWFISQFKKHYGLTPKEFRYKI